MPFSRRELRQLSMQLLYLWDANGSADSALSQQALGDATADVDLRVAAQEMAAKAWEGRETSDRWVDRLAPQWPVSRQPQVDRAIIRQAVWELTSTATPPVVVIDEAIELAKDFSTQNSAAFVNGVLDAILKEHQALITPPI